MSNPHFTRAVENLIWTEDGTVWATWRMSGLRYSGSVEEKAKVVAAHRVIPLALGGQGLQHSAIVPEDASAVVARMLEGVDLEELPLLVAEADASLDKFDELALGERYHWLSVPLPDLGRVSFLERGRAAKDKLTSAAGLPTAPLPEDEIYARLEQMAALQRSIPEPFRPAPVSPAEHLWIFNHARRRGQLDLPVPEGEPGVSHDLLTASGAAVGHLTIDEGATTDEGYSRADLKAQRVLKIVDIMGADLHGFAPSYQVPLAMADTPVGGITWPGCEVLEYVDRIGIDVDWAIPYWVAGREDVLAANRKAVRRLNDQYSQRDGEQGTGNHELDTAATLLGEYAALFADDRQEVEIQHALILCVSAAPGEGESGREAAKRAQEQADALASTMHSDLGIKMERIPGTLTDLWRGMLPGDAGNKTVRAYIHHTTSKNFARLVPFTGQRLGGARGPVPFLSEAFSRPRPVHLALHGYPEINKSGAVCAVGELGAGKSVFLKTMALGLVAYGGRFYSIDASADGEWAAVARAIPNRFCDGEEVPDHVVVSVLNPEWSMDPLRLLGVEDGASIAHAFLIQLLGVNDINARNALGVVLAPDYLLEHDLDSLSAVACHVLQGSLAEPGTELLAAGLRGWTRNKLARVLFDVSLPPVPLDVSATVWLTHGLELPTREEMDKPHLFAQMIPSKVLGRAYYRLLTALARYVCFADRSRPDALITDEMHRLANPENLSDLAMFLREGRRPKALLWGATHDIADLNQSIETDREETLASLIPTRVVMRCGGRGIAERAVRWLGYDSSDPQFEEEVKRALEGLSPQGPDGVVPEDRRGEAILRDAFGQVGVGRVLIPAAQALRAAVHTTPPKAKAFT